MEVTKILWSGLTGRTGFEAVKEARNMLDVDIVLGVSRRNMDSVIDIDGEKFEGVKWLSYDMDILWGNGLLEAVKKADIDVIVDFSHPDVFEKIVELAVRANVPLISGTSGLTDRQMAMLYDATNRIPVFRGGNFRFKVKKFIDEAVKIAKIHDGLVLCEEHWSGQPLPTEAAKELHRRVLSATGKDVQITNGAPFGAETLINQWTLYYDDSPDHNVVCRVSGFDELAEDILRIAKVMAKKPVKKGEFYDLDEIWDDLVSQVV